MRPAERRLEIIKILCRRRKERMCNLAAEFDVSMRTIQRDIFEIGFFIPINVKRGRYDGGVYIENTYSFDRMYMSNEEIYLLNRILVIITANPQLGFTTIEIDLLSRIIEEYTIPQK